MSLKNGSNLQGKQKMGAGSENKIHLKPGSLNHYIILLLLETLHSKCLICSFEHVAWSFSREDWIQQTIYSNWHVRLYLSGSSLMSCLFQWPSWLLNILVKVVNDQVWSAGDWLEKTRKVFGLKLMCSKGARRQVVKNKREMEKADKIC